MLFGCETLGRLNEAYEPQKGLCYFIIANYCFEVDLDLAQMYTIALRECDNLEGVSNFIPRKLRPRMPMEEAVNQEHVEKEITAPTDAEFLDAHNKEVAKAKTTILDSMKDPFIAHKSNKTTNKEMSRALIGLF